MMQSRVGKGLALGLAGTAVPRYSIAIGTAKERNAGSTWPNSNSYGRD